MGICKIDHEEVSVAGENFSNKDWMCSGFGILRVAALPYQVLEKLNLKETSRLINQYLEEKDYITDKRKNVGDCLYRLVNLLEDNDKFRRRKLLKLRRDIFNFKVVSGSIDWLNEIVDRLSLDEKKIVITWLAIHKNNERLYLQIESSFKHEIQNKLRPGLRGFLEFPEFRRAITFANSPLIELSQKETSLPKKLKPNYLENMLMAYGTRSITKTSPFSSFMGTTALPIELYKETALLEINNGFLYCKTNINRGVVSQILKMLFKQYAKKENLTLSVNKTLNRIGQNRYAAICGYDINFLGRPWNEKRKSVFRIPDVIGDLFVNKSGTLSWDKWFDFIESEGIAPKKIDKLLSTLIDRDVLISSTIVDTFDDDPASTLLAFLIQVKSKYIEQFQVIFDELRIINSSHQIDQTQKINIITQRILAFETLIRSSISTEVDARPLQNMLMDDCWIKDINGEIDARLMTPVKDLAKFLSTQIEVSPQYLKMSSLYVQRYGEGGKCQNVLDFLMSISDELVDVVELGNNINMGENEEAGVAMKGSVLGVTVQVQIIYNPSSGNEARWVINRVFDRPAWLASRFTFGDSKEHEFLRNELREWVTNVSADGESIDLVVNGYCNDLQAHSKITHRVLSWGGEQFNLPEDQVLPIGDVYLQHNIKTRELELYDKNDKKLSLVYLGSTYPAVNWGIPYILSILTQPFRLKRPISEPPKENRDYDWLYHKRRVYKSVILQRASWWVSSEYLIKNWFSDKGIKQLLNVETSRNSMNLPSTLFVQALIVELSTDQIAFDVLETKRKPMWVDLTNPFSLSYIKSLAQKNKWLCLTEVLPDKDNIWLKVDGKKHISELQIELFVKADGS